VGLINYHKPIGKDRGVDGLGTNANGDLVAVQLKFKSNPLGIVTLEDLAKTGISGLFRFNVDITKKNSVYLLTTTNKISYEAKDEFGNRLRIIDKTKIGNKINNNDSFWEYCYIEINKILNNTP
jgi:predicted helicase